MLSIVHERVGLEWKWIRINEWKTTLNLLIGEDLFTCSLFKYDALKGFSVTVNMNIYIYLRDN